MFLTAAALIAGLAIPTATPREELTARAKQLGFPQAEQIARDALPGARLVAGGEATVGAPRLGGDPDLPPAMTWPTCRGHRLTFLAQLPLADVAAVTPGAVPASGTLAVFADLKPDESGVTRMEQEYGHVGKDTCVVVRTLRGTLARRKTPKRIATLRSRPVQLKPTLTVPDAYVAKERYKLTKQQANDYWRLESGRRRERSAGRVTTSRCTRSSAGRSLCRTHRSTAASPTRRASPTACCCSWASTSACASPSATAACSF
jgi:hypothetical protein